MPLTDTAVRNAKPGPKPVKMYDANGLFLLLGLVFGIGMANTQIFVALACGANRPLQSRRSKRMACGTKTRWSSWR